MNDVFYEYLDDFVVCYIDDIFIFSKNLEEHEHVQLVLDKFKEIGFYAKWNFYIIFGDGICMDLHKV